MTRERGSELFVVHQVRYLLARSSYAIVPSFTKPDTITADGHLERLAPCSLVVAMENPGVAHV